MFTFTVTVLLRTSFSDAAELVEHGAEIFAVTSSS